MDMKQIDRINTLYHKSKSVGLTPEEKKEQEMLRKEYIAAIRANLRGTLNQISIKEPDGTITDLGKKFGNKDESKDANKDGNGSGNADKEGN